MMFRDRVDAGHRLAKRLKRFEGASDTVVLGIPRGGVVVAAEVARILGLPLDVVVAAKVTDRGNSEYAIGSVTTDGAVLMNPFSGYTHAEVVALAGPAWEKVAAKIDRFRRVCPEAPLAGSTAIVVDDGLATGLTAKAAVAYVRRQKAARIILAVPVASESAAESLRRSVDEVVAVDVPIDFAAVAQFYEQFDQTLDDEVERLLREASVR